MRITPSLALAHVAAIVCDACLKNRIPVVLSGGACVSIYTQNKYTSYDLDFVLETPVSRSKVRAVLSALGFCEEGRHFRHPRTPYIVEFLLPPLSVGQEPVREILEIRRGGKSLRLLSPTDCVKDRLAAFYHWNDRPSLDQAVLVCRDAEVDLREVRRWSLSEEMKDKYSLFKKHLAEAEK